MRKYTSCQVNLTSVRTSRTDLKSFDIEASLDCEQQKTEQSYTVFIVQLESAQYICYKPPLSDMKIKSYYSNTQV